MAFNDINQNKGPVVFKVYDDGYIVRGMTPEDAKIVQEWYSGMGVISPYDLDVVLASFPPGGRGFYIGEYQGVVVSSCVRLPWGGGAFYGSYYYVHEDYRGKHGFGTRLRDEVAYGHVQEAGGKLCVDAVTGSVAKKNTLKFHYNEAWVTARYCGEAKDFGVEYDGQLVPANSVPFDDLIAYDNKNFVSKDYLPRRKFLEQWINITDGVAVVALDTNGQIVGFGQRRPALSCQPKNHLVGPLYADSSLIARATFQELCRGVIGQKVTSNIWTPNEASVKIMEDFGLTKVFDVLRMHANGDPEEYKDTVYGLTNIDTCGF